LIAPLPAAGARVPIRALRVVVAVGQSPVPDLNFLFEGITPNVCVNPNRDSFSVSVQLLGSQRAVLSRVKKPEAIAALRAVDAPS